MDPLDDLRENHKLMEILRGIGFSSGIHTSYTLSCQDFDTNLLSFLPIYKKNEHRYYAIFGKKWRQHANYNLKYFMEFLLKPLKEFKVSFYREKDRNKQLTYLKLLIDKNLRKILPNTCSSDNTIMDFPKSDFNPSQDIVDNTIGKQKFQLSQEKLEQWRAKIAFEMRDNQNYWKKERESMSKADFLEYKQNFEAKMSVPTTPHKKELKKKSLAIIEYA
ncbi:5209_t:CDS:2, partial [Gigaspora margarita]